MPKIGILITARLKSTRLPFKLLNDLNGKEVVRHVINRSKALKTVDQVVLCTSWLSQDVPLTYIATEENIPYFTGHDTDVLLRLRDAADYFGIDSFVSITADNPFFCLHHANRVADLLRHLKTIDFIYIDGLPIGAAVYGLNLTAVKAACEIKTQVDTEIWGPFINKPEFFNVKCLKATNTYDINARLTIDEPKDYEFAVALCRLSGVDPSRMDLLLINNILKANPELLEINREVKQRALDSNIVSEIENLFHKDSNRIRDIIAKYRMQAV